MIDASRYTITIKKVDVDGQSLYLATVKELPDVGPYAETPDAAYALALDIIKTLFDMAKENGRKFPVPIEEEPEFSGRFSLRLPKSLHQKGAQIADVEGVSLNQYFVSTIAEAIGVRTAITKSAVGHWSTSDLLSQITSKDVQRRQVIHKAVSGNELITIPSHRMYQT